MTYRLLAAAAILAAAPAFAQDAQTGATGSAATLSEAMIGTDGQPIGQAEMIDTPNGVLVRLTIQADKIPAGEHAMHFHEKGDCSDFAEGFNASGGHHNPTGKEHGFEAEGGPHAGDMPNITAAAGQQTVVETFNPMVRFRQGDAPLMDADGSALIVHAKADDYESQPSGDAGDRLGCVAIAGGN